MRAPVRSTPSRPRVAGTALLAMGAALLLALMALTLVIAARPGPLGPDDWLHHWIVSHRDPVLTGAARVATLTGSGPFVYPATAVVAAWLWVRDAKRLSAILVLSVVTGAAVTGVLKILLDRPRPPARDILGPVETTLSFPSGHTTTGSVLVIGAALVLTAEWTRAARRLALTASAGWAAAIGWSRIYLGFHWLSDVVASALLASIILLAAGAALPVRGTDIRSGTDIRRRWARGIPAAAHR